MLISETLKAFVIENLPDEKDHKPVLDTLEQTAIEAIRYTPKVRCGWSFEEYFKNDKDSTQTDKAILYGLYRMKLDNLHAQAHKRIVRESK